MAVNRKGVTKMKKLIGGNGTYTAIVAYVFGKNTLELINKNGEVQAVIFKNKQDLNNFLNDMVQGENIEKLIKTIERWDVEKYKIYKENANFDYLKESEG